MERRRICKIQSSDIAALISGEGSFREERHEQDRYAHAGIPCDTPPRHSQLVDLGLKKDGGLEIKLRVPNRDQAAQLIVRVSLPRYADNLLASASAKPFQL